MYEQLFAPLTNAASRNPIRFFVPRLRFFIENIHLQHKPDLLFILDQKRLTAERDRFYSSTGFRKLFSMCIPPTDFQRCPISPHTFTVCYTPNVSPFNQLMPRGTAAYILLAETRDQLCRKRS